MAYEELGCFVEMAALQAAALFLDVAELIECFLELAGEARAMQTKRSEGAMSVDNIEIDGSLLRGRVDGAREQLGFKEWDAVEAPRGVGDFVDELSLGGCGGGVLIEKLLDVALVGFGILSRQDSGTGGKAMAEGVERGPLLARFGARTGGVQRVRAVRASARLLD
jgi:hypothetical protein